jgi:hypothetical protein
MTAEEPRPNVLYHYTTAAGLLGILESNTLHATDVRHLNDLRELVLAQEAVELAVDVAASSWPETSIMAGRLNQLRVMLLDSKNESQFGPFVASFCEDGDLLSQWRSYGRGGYALGFDSDGLSKLDPVPLLDTDDGHWEQQGFGPAPVDLRKVMYDAEGLAKVVSSVIEFAQRNGPGDDAMPPYLETHAEAFKAMASVKDAAFEEEAEWRLIVMGQGGLIRDRFKARASGAIVPYVPIEVDIAENLREIVIGPGLYERGELNEDGNEAWPGGRDAVSRLLGFYNVRGATVRFSEVPFRGIP